MDIHQNLLSDSCSREKWFLMRTVTGIVFIFLFISFTTKFFLNVCSWFIIVIYSPISLLAYLFTYLPSYSFIYLFIYLSIYFLYFFTCEFIALFFIHSFHSPYPHFRISVLMYNVYSMSRHGHANYHGLVSLLHVFC